MKKVSIALLILFIICIFSFAAIRYFANEKSQDNWFNDHWRPALARYPLARTVFNLHWDGDARANYLLSKPFSKLLLVIDREENCQLSPAVLDQVQTKINAAIQKPSGVTSRESRVFVAMEDSMSNQQIHQVADRYRISRLAKDTAVLYVLCLGSYASAPSNIGLTVNEDGLAIFWSTISQLSNNNPSVRDEYIVSTILHEFGHQLGLNHVQDPGCIMSSAVESPGSVAAFRLPSVTDYCPAERAMIDQIKKTL